MEIIIGFILLIIIIGVVASSRFASLATSKGYHPNRAKKYPYFIAAGAFFFNVLGQTMLSFFSQDMLTLLFICWGSFVVLAMITILLKAYNNIKNAPDQKQAHQPMNS